MDKKFLESWINFRDLILYDSKGIGLDKKLELIDKLMELENCPKVLIKQWPEYRKKLLELRN